MTHDDEAHDRWYQTTVLNCPEGGEPELVLTNVQLAAGGTLWVEGSGTLTLECYSNEDCILQLSPSAEIYE